MTRCRKIGYALHLSILLGSVCALAQGSIQASPASPPKSVTLTPGVCAAVTEGDIVAFEWNPAFENPADAGDLKNFHLTFGKVEDDGAIRRVGSRISLSALPTRGQGTPIAGSLSAPVNGIYQMQFRVTLHGVPSGEYDLIKAKAETGSEQNVSDKTAEMTNSPLRYHFCLNVTAPMPSGRG